VHTGYGLEYIVLIDVKLPPLHELVGKNVEKYFRVGFGVYVASIVAEYITLELPRINQVAVVGERDSERGIHVKGLRLGGRCAPGGRIPDMPDPHVAAQAQHVLGSKNLTHEAVILSLMQARSIASSNTRRILAAML
jgi:hypothetical protein